MPRTEDNDFHARLRTLGYGLYLSPDIRAFYAPRQSLRGPWRQYASNGAGIARLLVSNPRDVSVRHLTPAAFVSSLVSLSMAALQSSAARYALEALVSVYVLALIAFSARSWFAFTRPPQLAAAAGVRDVARRLRHRNATRDSLRRFCAAFARSPGHPARGTGMARTHANARVARQQTPEPDGALTASHPEFDHALCMVVAAPVPPIVVARPCRQTRGAVRGSEREKSTDSRSDPQQARSRRRGATRLTNGGGRGIRTPGTLSGSTVFKTAALNHSAIPPRAGLLRPGLRAVAYLRLDHFLRRP